MHELFNNNFEQFSGQGWTLDSLLYGVAIGQYYKSALHSFAVEDAKMILQPAKDDTTVTPSRPSSSTVLESASPPSFGDRACLSGIIL